MLPTREPMQVPLLVVMPLHHSAWAGTDSNERAISSALIERYLISLPALRMRRAFRPEYGWISCVALMPGRTWPRQSLRHGRRTPAQDERTSGPPQINTKRQPVTPLSLSNLTLSPPWLLIAPLRPANT